MPAFNNKAIPAPVPATDLETLARLISAPQKAAELFDKYRAAREEYEALRASIAEEMASLEKRQAELDADTQKSEAAYKEFVNIQNTFSNAKASWEKNKQAVETSLADRAKALEARERAVSEAAAAANTQTIALSEQSASQNKWYADKLLEVQDANDKLAVREAAVAAREAKADELAKLLKGI